MQRIMQLITLVMPSTLPVMCWTLLLMTVSVPVKPQSLNPSSLCDSTSDKVLLRIHLRKLDADMYDKVFKAALDFIKYKVPSFKFIGGNLKRVVLDFCLTQVPPPFVCYPCFVFTLCLPTYSARALFPGLQLILMNTKKSRESRVQRIPACKYFRGAR